MSAEHDDSFDRRKFVKTVAATGVAATVPSILVPGAARAEFELPSAAAEAARRATGDLRRYVKRPEQLVGTRDWQIPSGADARNREIEGYASATSIDAGDSIQLFVSTMDRRYRLEVFRLGWYNGAGAIRVTDPVERDGILQPTPIADAATGLIECDWRRPYELRTDKRWRSGIYLVKLTGIPSGKQRYVKFVLRDDNARADLLFQSSVTTDQAYNNWPSVTQDVSGPGKSLYGFNSSEGVPAFKVSYNRPYSEGLGTGLFFAWEINMLRFLEREGYDVGYITNHTTHSDRKALTRARGFLSVGHDEYWSNEMRANVERARDEGVHLGFFSANNCYWRVRFEPSALNGRPRGTMVCYKGADGDPFLKDRERATVRWRDAPINRPENALIGVMYFLDPVDGDVVVDRADHWVFAGTRLQKGDLLPGLLGYEVDRIFEENGQAPRNLVRLCHSPAFNANTGLFTDYADMTIYRARSGAYVFATGTIQWSWGLDDFGVSPRTNEAAKQMTRNVLNRFIAKRRSDNDDD